MSTASSVTAARSEAAPLVEAPHPPIRLHLVRHGETLFNTRHQTQGWCDSPLTHRGRRQVAALGAHFADVPLVAAFTSDLTRTRDTCAAALAGHPDLVATPTSDLREWNFGSWEGQQDPDLWIPLFAARGYDWASGAADAVAAMTAEGFDELLDAIALSDPLGMAETGAEVRERIERGMRTVVGEAAALGGGDVLVVTHGAVLGSIQWALSPGRRPRLGIPNCGIIRVDVVDGVATIHELDPRCALLDEVTSA